MTAGVDIQHFRGEPAVECEAPNCLLSAYATRERARQHARSTGHTVRVIIEDTTVYRRSETES